MTVFSQLPRFFRAATISPTRSSRCACWHAHGRWRVGRVEDTASGRKRVEVRGLHLRVSRASHVARVPLIGEDEDYVGSGIHGCSSVIRYNDFLLLGHIPFVHFAYHE